jgi:hypothetical protein
MSEEKQMSDDWTTNPEWQRWVKDVRKNLVPAMRGSAYVMSLVPHDNEPDVKFAVELGMAIMMDKPIITVVEPGSKPSRHLVRVSDAILEVNPDAPDAAAELAGRVKEAMRQMGLEQKRGGS